MTKAARYIVQMFGAAAVVIAIISAFNLAIDPLAWRSNSRFLLYSPNDKAVKTHWIRLYEHDGLMIGSSKVNRIDPRTIAKPRLFNAAFDAAKPEEILGFLKRYANDEKLVLLGLDFFMMSGTDGDLDEQSFERQDRPPLYGRTLLAWAGYLPSLETIGLSVSAVHNSILGSPGDFSPAGNRIISPEQVSRPRNRVAYDSVLGVLAKHHYNMTHYSVRRVEIIKRIKAWAAARGIRLLVFLNPLNQDEAALLRGLPSWRYFMRFRHDMREIFPDLVDLTDAFPDRSLYFPNDPFHYLPQTGTQIIEAVLSRGAADTATPATRQSP